jgi:hypothetical protein
VIDWLSRLALIGYWRILRKMLMVENGMKTLAATVSHEGKVSDE